MQAKEAPTLWLNYPTDPLKEEKQRLRNIKDAKKEKEACNKLQEAEYVKIRMNCSMIYV